MAPCRQKITTQTIWMMWKSTARSVLGAGNLESVHAHDRIGQPQPNAFRKSSHGTHCRNPPSGVSTFAKHGSSQPPISLGSTSHHLAQCIKPIKPSALVFHMPRGFSDSYPQFPHLEHVTCIASTPAAPPATSRRPAHRQVHPPRPALRPSTPSAGRRASPLPRAPAARLSRRARLRRSVR